MKIRIVIRPGKIVIFCAQNQETEVLGIEMDYDHTHKMLVFSFVRELASFHVVNLCLNINDFVTKSHILVYEIDNCPKGLLCRGGSRKSCVSVCPVSVSGVRSPVSGPFSIRFQSSKMKIPVQFLRKRGPKRVPSATFGSKSEMDLGQRIIQIL